MSEQQLDLILLSDETVEEVQKVIRRYPRVGDDPVYDVKPSGILMTSTPAHYYYYAADFGKPYFKFLPKNLNQLIRMIFGFVVVSLSVEQLFTGPTESMVILAYLNVWGYIATFLTNVL